MDVLQESLSEQVRQLSAEREQLRNAIDEKDKENYELRSKVVLCLLNGLRMSHPA